MADDILDALDQMIGGLGNPDFGHLDQLDAPSGQGFPEDFCCFGQISRFDHPKTGSIGELEIRFPQAHARARANTLLYVQNSESVQTGENPGQILGHSECQSGEIGQICRSLVSATRSHIRAKDEMRWHLDHGERVPRALCAGCRMPIGDSEAMDLADDNRVHLDPDYRCLIAWGEAWRSAARRHSTGETKR